MPFDWGEKLLDVVVGGVPGLLKVLPEHWRKQVAVRADDFNPFATIAANEDLLRALRLAWIEAGLEIDAQVLKMTELPEWQHEASNTRRFSQHFQIQVRKLRHEACNRNVHPGNTAIDVHLSEVLVHVPDYIRSTAGPRPGEVLTSQFAATLAAITGWPEREVPTLYPRLAARGVRLEGTSSNRAFGELVFAAFAEIIKSPNRYHEAGVAFEIAIGGMTRELVQATLTGLGDIDSKIDALLRDMRAGPDRVEDLGTYLARINALCERHLAELESQVVRVGVKLDDAAAVAARRHESSQALLQQLLRAVESQGRVGDRPNQVAHDTLLALARRLKPEELLDFDRAVKELDFAIGVALQVMAQGEALDDISGFVDDVMHRVAQLTSAGRLEEGAASIDDALSELDRREAVQRDVNRQRRRSLLQAAIRQGGLLRDTDRVVSAVVALAALLDPACPTETDTFAEWLQGFYNEGRDRGINFCLEVALSLARLRLNAAPSSNKRFGSLMWLGHTLLTLGERERGRTRLHEAETAYRLALMECTRERMPLEWARATGNLGVALSTLGMRDGNTARLEEAVQALNAALDGWPRERMPLDRALVQSSLGTALQELGLRESGTGRLEDAVQAYRVALKDLTRERAPREWARTQLSLGAALESLGTRNNNSAHLQDAVHAYRQALEESTRERLPLDWAKAQTNLGNALNALSRSNDETSLLEEAVQAYRRALKECTQDRAPLDWARVQYNLGNALLTLARRGSGTALLLNEAIQAFRAALQEWIRERVPREWAWAQLALAGALETLSGHERSIAHLREALQAYRAALEEFTQHRSPKEFFAITKRIAVLTRLEQCDNTELRQPGPNESQE